MRILLLSFSLIFSFAKRGKSERTNDESLIIKLKSIAKLTSTQKYLFLVLYHNKVRFHNSIIRIDL